MENVSVFNEHIYQKAASILFEVLMALYESRQAFGIENDKSAAAVAKQLMDRNVTKKITVSQICESLTVSQSALERGFKKKYKIAPAQYLMNNRIAFAKKMLLENMKSIKEIAAALYFPDSHYSSNVFKKKVGVTPSEYRRQRVHK